MRGADIHSHHIHALLRIGKPDFFADEIGVSAVRATRIWMNAQADFATQIKRIDHISAVSSMRECARVCVCAGLDCTVLFRRQQTLLLMESIA